MSSRNVRNGQLKHMSGNTTILQEKKEEEGGELNDKEKTRKMQSNYSFSSLPTNITHFS